MGSYHIIGGDGEPYGPYTADQIRELLQDNRLKSDSKIQPENGEWTTVQALPEFSATNPLPPALPPVAADQTAGYNPQPYAAPPGIQSQQPPNNPLAVTGMVLGISTLVLGCCCGRIPFLGIIASLISLVTPIAGLICSFIARSQIKKSNGAQGGEGMALAGIICSGVYLLLVLGIVALVVAGAVAWSQFGGP